MAKDTPPTPDAKPKHIDTPKNNTPPTTTTARMTVSSSSKIYSSLPLQIIIYFNERFFPVMWLILIALFVYKGSAFPYTGAVLPLEVFGLFPFAVLEAARLFLGEFWCSDFASGGHRGNKMEDRGSFGIFLGLTVVTLFAHLFYCLWQTYV
ncbi:Transmembrane protein 80 [Podochytrium sp. JEL0797]|nr:Transmembrane protein 80 [Podochytrium sp. JEL0797]